MTAAELIEALHYGTTPADANVNIIGKQFNYGIGSAYLGADNEVYLMPSLPPGMLDQPVPDAGHGACGTEDCCGTC